jgi:hypothetical protein
MFNVNTLWEHNYRTNKTNKTYKTTNPNGEAKRAHHLTIKNK